MEGYGVASNSRATREVMAVQTEAFSRYPSRKCHANDGVKTLRFFDASLGVWQTGRGVEADRPSKVLYLLYYSLLALRM